MIPPLAAVALISFSVCVALVPVVRMLCLRFGAVDNPGPLKIHTRPVPRLGGLAVVVSIIAGIFFCCRQPPSAIAYFLAALSIIWIAGFADDLRDISPLARIAAQTFSGVLLWLGGWRFLPEIVSPKFGGLSAILACGLVVAVANGFNFLDGTDGLAAGVAAIVGASYLAISFGMAIAPITLSVAAGLAGSCVAFLVFNSPRASIFLGDSGSTALGFCVAFLALNSTHAIHPAEAIQFAPLLIAALPLLDAALALTRRLRRKASPLLGDRRHIYDLLMIERGWSPRRVVFVAYAITASLAVVAWFGQQYGLRGFLVLSGLSLAGLLIPAIRLGCLRAEQPPTTLQGPGIKQNRAHLSSFR
ncbi:MAG: glycosyltransferase family 4 protein [Candidatus Acidiferrales bacterium]